MFGGGYSGILVILTTGASKKHDFHDQIAIDSWVIFTGSNGMNFTSLNHKKHIFLDKLQGLLYHIIKIEAFDKLRTNYLVKIKLIYQLLACYI